MSWAPAPTPRRRRPGALAADPPAGARHHHPGHHPPPGAEGLRPFHAGGGQRQRGVRPGDAAPDLPPDHRPAGALQRPGDRPAAGHARGDHPGRPAPSYRPTDLRAEDLLDEIHRQRDQSRKARAAADKARQEAETLRAELTRRLEKIEDERRQVLEKARKEAEEQLQELQDELREARKSLARPASRWMCSKRWQEQVEILQETVEAPVERRQAELPGQPVRRAIRLGDKVRLRTLNTNGVVTSLGEDEAELQIGALRIRARLAELQLAGEPEPAAGGRTSMPDGQLPTARDLLTAPKLQAARKSRPEAILPESPGIELDLRGQRAEEALDALDRYLDAAYLAGLPWVRIIHGKGTGKLRQSVRETLERSPAHQILRVGR